MSIYIDLTTSAFKIELKKQSGLWLVEDICITLILSKANQILYVLTYVPCDLTKDCEKNITGIEFGWLGLGIFYILTLKMVQKNL